MPRELWSKKLCWYWSTISTRQSLRLNDVTVLVACHGLGELKIVMLTSTPRAVRYKFADAWCIDSIHYLDARSPHYGRAPGFYSQEWRPIQRVLKEINHCMTVFDWFIGDRARLASLYSDFRSQRSTNPDGYAANVAAWQRALKLALWAGKFACIGSEQDVLSLRTGQDLLQALETREWGKPLALGTVIVRRSWKGFPQRDAKTRRVGRSYQRWHNDSSRGVPIDAAKHISSRSASSAVAIYIMGSRAIRLRGKTPSGGQFETREIRGDVQCRGLLRSFC